MSYTYYFNLYRAVSGVETMNRISRSTDGLSYCGSTAQNIPHSVSFQSLEKIPTSNPGLRHTCDLSEPVGKRNGKQEEGLLL